MAEETRLTVIFSGSCGFVPHEDGNRVRVLLPSRSDGWQAQDGETVVPPHKAVVKFRRAYAAADNERNIDFLYIDQDEPVGICFLENEVLTLPASVDGRFFLDKAKITNKITPEPSESRSFDWVANVDGFCPAAAISRKYLTLRPEAPFAAMIDISEGIIESDWVPSDVFDFHPVSPDDAYEPQCLAGQVRLSIKVSGAQAEIRTDGSLKKPLRLRAIDSEIRVEISNEVLDDIILGPGFRRLKAASDFDFELLYALTDAPPNHWHVPTNIARTKGEFLGVKTADCKPKRFARAEFEYKRAEH